MERPIPKNRATIFIFLFLSTVSSLSSYADQGHPCAPQVVCGEVGRIQISEKGAAKILETGIDAITNTIDIKSELNEAIAKSPDFPVQVELGNNSNFGMKATLDNLRFDELSFGPSKVDIEDGEVSVCVPVEEMDIKLDADFDVWGNKLSQKGAGARIKKDSPQKPEVCFTGEVDANGDFSELVAVPWEEPKDVVMESKRALLSVDLNQATNDEIIFNYLTLYSMEEGHELPTNFSWSNIWNMMGDFSPENAEKFFDVDQMRKNLIAIKGQMPPLKEEGLPKTGLRNYLGTMEVDLALDKDQERIAADESVWDDMVEIMSRPTPEREAPPDEYRIMSWIKGVGNSVVNKAYQAADATKRGIAGIGNRVSMKGESLLRERFLPYIQEKFNKSATSNPPVMTAIAKTAEKELIPVARKHANRALQKARELIKRDNLARAKAHVPGFQLQDVIDHGTLRRLEAKLGPKPLQDLVLAIDGIKSPADYKRVKEEARLFLSHIDEYADAIADNSTDERTHRFLQAGLGKLTANITDFLGQNPHGRLDNGFLNLRQNVLYKLQTKERTLARNIAHKRELMSMEVIPSLFSSRTGGPEVSLTFPELCREGIGRMKGPIPGTRGHDFSATVGIDGVNAMLKRMQRGGAFDFCLYGGEYRTCQSGENYDHKCRMELPPRMVWNGSKGSHQLILDGVKCESRFLNAQKDCGLNVNPHKSFFHAIAYPFAKLVGGTCKLATDLADELVTGGVGQNQGQVAIDISPQICGQALCFDTKLAGVNVEADMSKLSPTLKGMAGLVTAIASPVTNAVKTQIVDDQLMSYLENDISQPLQAPLGVAPKSIQSKPGSITIFADFERTPAVESVVSACLQNQQSCPERFF